MYWADSCVTGGVFHLCRTLWTPPRYIWIAHIRFGPKLSVVQVPLCCASKRAPRMTPSFQCWGRRISFRDLCRGQQLRLVLWWSWRSTRGQLTYNLFRLYFVCSDFAVETADWSQSESRFDAPKQCRRRCDYSWWDMSCRKRMEHVTCSFHVRFWTFHTKRTSLFQY